MVSTTTPYKLERMAAPDLVRAAIQEKLVFKLVAAELKKRPPSKAAAEAAIEAYRQGEAPPWLTALLLGECRDKVGYATVREILLSAPRQLAESYAGTALAQIGGPEAFEDLKTLMFTAPDRRSRGGAAYGLEALGLPEAAPAILEAALAGKIKCETGGRILGGKFVNEAMVLGLLQSEDKRQVRLATEIIGACVLSITSGEISSEAAKSFTSHPSRALLEAIDRVLSNPDITMAPRKRSRLREWRNKMAQRGP